MGRERCGLLCCNGASVWATQGHWGPDPEFRRLGVGYEVVIRAKCAPDVGETCGDGVRVGYYHSHPENNGFSQDDKDYRKPGQICAYVGLPDGSVLRYNCHDDPRDQDDVVFIESGR